MMRRERNYTIFNPPAKIGIIGGGQLGKMISIEAKRMGYHVTILDPTPSSPAAQVADEQITASFKDKKAIINLAKSCDVITYEFEHIDADILIKLEAEGCNIYPSGKTLKIIQDKYIQKKLLKNAGIQVPNFIALEDINDIEKCLNIIALPFVVKTRSGGYDGKGNHIIKTKTEIEQLFEELKDHSLMAEEFIEFERELSIIVAKDFKGNYEFYPVVENVHNNSILRLTRAPAQIGTTIENKIKSVAKNVLEILDDCGVFCIEFFITKNEEIYINEIAPRPHNSGHYTIEACVTSQFEQLVRIITGMPLGSTKLRCPCVMANILGNDSVEGQHSFEGVDEILAEEDIHLHLYGKHFTKEMKKIGHLTALARSVEVAEARALKAIEKLVIKPI